MGEQAGVATAPGPEGRERSDADLIAASRSGDAAAYAVLYERHSRAVRTLARQVARDDAEADDLVSETFARVLDVVKRGGGPEIGFRAYALTALRRIKYDRARGETRQVVLDDLDPYAPGVPFDDPALEGLEHSMVARAFASLPERWQTVLWHTEIEGAKPAEVAPLLGISANGVAALAYRAREGLRQAYLQMHLSGAVQEGCQPALERMGAYVRGGLSKRESAVVERHLDECDTCRGLYAELADVNTGLRTVIGPIVLGPAVGGYLAGVHGGGLFGLLWLQQLRRVPKQAAAAAAVAAALAIVLPLGWVAWEGHTSNAGGRAGGSSSQAAGPQAPSQPAKPHPNKPAPPSSHRPNKQQHAGPHAPAGASTSTSSSHVVAAPPAGSSSGQPVRPKPRPSAPSPHRPPPSAPPSSSPPSTPPSSSPPTSPPESPPAEPTTPPPSVPSVPRPNPPQLPTPTTPPRILRSLVPSSPPVSVGPDGATIHTCQVDATVRPFARGGPEVGIALHPRGGLVAGQDGCGAFRSG